MKIVGYAGEWTADALARLVKFSATRCKYFVLIGAKAGSAEVATSLDELTQHLHSRTLATAWPGTVTLSDDRHELLKFDANDASCNVLIERVLPELTTGVGCVEDLSFLRANGRPFFVTITHEHEAFFKVDQDEIHELEAAIGARNLVDEGEDQLPEDTY